MGWAFFATISKKACKGRCVTPYVFTAHPDITDEDMLEQALWLKRNGYRADQAQAFLPSPMTTAMRHAGRKLLRKVTPETEGVYIPMGLRRRLLQKRRRLHKAFLCYHVPDNWPLLRAALRRMGRADLIGPGKHQLVPACQPDQTNLTPEGARLAV